MIRDYEVIGEVDEYGIVRNRNQKFLSKFHASGVSAYISWVAEVGYNNLVIHGGSDTIDLDFSTNFSQDAEENIKHLEMMIEEITSLRDRSLEYFKEHGSSDDWLEVEPGDIPEQGGRIFLSDNICRSPAYLSWSSHVGENWVTIHREYETVRFNLSTNEHKCSGDGQEDIETLLTELIKFRDIIVKYHAEHGSVGEDE